MVTWNKIEYKKKYFFDIIKSMSVLLLFVYDCIKKIWLLIFMMKSKVSIVILKMDVKCKL